jgi:quercetin dioxygenase-like cupin family protein
MRLSSSVLAASATLAALLSTGALAQADAPATSATTLLETGAAVDGAPFAYPTAGAAQVTAVDVVFPPGSRTGWHQHDVPLFNYVVEGALTVTYADGTERVYSAGQAVMEAVSVAHWGRNDGDVNARLLTVVLGAEGVPYTAQRPDLGTPAP